MAFIRARSSRACSQQVFSAAEAEQARIHVVVAEALMVVQKDRLPGVNLDRMLPHIRSMNHGSNYTLLALAPTTVIASHQYVQIPDIFDRLIVTYTE